MPNSGAKRLTERLSEQNVLNIRRVDLRVFAVQLSCETVLILRRTQLDIMYIAGHVKRPLFLSDFIDRFSK
jgi:hypothetical protein